jgi:hypothetical protein
MISLNRPKCVNIYLSGVCTRVGSLSNELGRAAVDQLRMREPELGSVSLYIKKGMIQYIE